MYCGQCGHNNPDDASFCKSCGKPLAKSDTQRHGIPRALKIAGVAAALAAVLVVSIFAVKRVWFTDEQPSADKIARELTRATNEEFSSGFSESSINSWLNTFGELVPEEAAGVKRDDGANLGTMVMVEQNYAEQLFLDEMLEEEWPSDYSQLPIHELSSFKPFVKDLDINFEYYASDQLTRSELDSINGHFEENGIELRATEGNTLGISMSITALKDTLGLHKGETVSHSVERTRLFAIAVGDRWYLWCCLDPCNRYDVKWF